MAELLPLFPLTTVLFPEMLLPLHIFEPRYRLLVRRCMDDDRPFGVVLIRSGQEVGATAEPHAIGTEAKIMAFSPLSDGRSYIVVRGIRRYALEQAIPDTEPYLVGRVRYLDEPEGAGALERAALAVEAYGQYLVAVMAVTDDARGDRATSSRRCPRTRRRIGSPRASRWMRRNANGCSSRRAMRRASRRRRTCSSARRRSCATCSCAFGPTAKDA